jgi:hypothetical protein
MLTTAIAWLDPTSIPRNDFFKKEYGKKTIASFFGFVFITSNLCLLRD